MKRATGLPKRRQLEAALNAETDRDAMARVSGALTITGRRANEYRSSRDSEIVKCRTASGRTVVLFVKYDTPSPWPRQSYRRGLGYEARVYRAVLGEEWSPATVCFAAGVLRGSRREFLALRYLVGYSRLSHLGESVSVEEAMRNAARKLGCFHRMARSFLGRRVVSEFLFEYSSSFFQEWLARTVRCVRTGPGRVNWLEAFARRDAGYLVRLLTRGPQTVIHGEAYPDNILVGSDDIVFVDWECAALGAGEIDLAALIEGWPSSVADMCIRAYRAARWPDGGREQFAVRLAAAQAFLEMRFLGDHEGLVSSEEGERRLEKLRCRFSELRGSGLGERGGD